jgi:hypothetical protein
MRKRFDTAIARRGARAAEAIWCAAGYLLATRDLMISSQPNEVQAIVN